MPEDKITPVEFAASVKAKYPQYKDVPDGVLVSKVLEKYPEYKNKLNLGASLSEPEPSPISRFGERLLTSPLGIPSAVKQSLSPGPVGELASKGAGALGLSKGTSDVVGYAAEKAVDPFGMGSSIMGIPGQAGQVADAAKFYSPLLSPTRMIGSLAERVGVLPTDGALTKGTVMEKGTPTMMAQAAPEIAADIASGASWEALFRGVPAGVEVAKPVVGKAMTGVGKAMQTKPGALTLGGVPGAIIGREVGHPFIGYGLGTALAKSVGKWMQGLGARLATEFPGQVDHLGPIPGTKAFDDFAKKAVEPTEAPKPAPKLLGKSALLGDVAPTGEEVTGSVAAQKRAMKILSEKGSAVDSDVAARLIAGGRPVNEFLKMRPEYEPRAQALIQEMQLGPLRTQAAKEYASHGIPTFNDWVDKYMPTAQVKSPADALNIGETYALPGVWNEQERMVAPIANNRVSAKGISGEIGKQFNPSELKGNSVFRARVVAKLKEYSGRQNITVGKLFKDVTDLNIKLRDRTLPYETRQVMQAEADVLRDRLYQAYKDNLPQDMYDEAIIQRQKYGALKEMLKDIRRTHGKWLNKGMDSAPSGNKSLKGVTMNQVFEDIFKHEKGKPPVEYKAPIPPAKPTVTTEGGVTKVPEGVHGKGRYAKQARDRASQEKVRTTGKATEPQGTSTPLVSSTEDLLVEKEDLLGRLKRMGNVGKTYADAIKKSKEFNALPVNEQNELIRNAMGQMVETESEAGGVVPGATGTGAKISRKEKTP